MVLDVASRAEAEAIWAGDPASLAGMRQPAVIRFWNPAILNRTEIDRTEINRTEIA